MTNDESDKMNEMKKEFLSELKTLLKKYDVTIWFSVSACSDTYGLNDEKMIIYHKDENWLEVYGWGINHTDIQ
jgi:hypothetical protein